VLKIEEDAIVEIVKNGYSLEFGAREMRRIITHSIETFLADTMIGRDIKRGEVIQINVNDIKKYLKNRK
jgi:ATP-dependent Clp protease ATP-binding subunit ClpB